MEQSYTIKGGHIVEVNPEDLVILTNMEGLDPDIVPNLSGTRMMFVTDQVGVVIIRDWQKNHNIGIG